ncbi:endoplasmic reticulum protein SC65-like [Alosa sapidissima]|uniref:endoplasmic reticulum protein SC65-like n=1 Tax=Alosa sapidissima TaxID=34773 RepID=UPI001C082EF8|nr:endoplasmic reticulum protein SC65-like [Alosa sapidissima]
MGIRASELLLLCVGLSLHHAAADLGEQLDADRRGLGSVYGRALALLEERDWAGSVRLLELSVRLHRLLMDSVAFCAQSCRAGRSDAPHPPGGTPDDLHVYWTVLQRASCVKKCRARFPELQFSWPGKEILRDFERRVPYKYLHVAYEQLNDNQRAASAAHTFLQRNPGDVVMAATLSRYRYTEGLEDLEEKPYEAVPV